MELANFIGKNEKLQLQIQPIKLKIISCRTMCNLFISPLKDQSPKMGFLEVRVGSNIVKNIYNFLIFLNKVEQCSSFVEKK
jgi:hypothetical protein